MRCDVRIARLGEVAVRGAANEATVARRVEPTLGFAVGDDRRGRLVLLMVSLATTASVTPAASAIAVELLVVLPASRAVFIPVAALVAVMVPMLAMLAGRPLVRPSILTGRTLLLLSRLARRFRRGWRGRRCRRRRGQRRRCWGVLGRDRDRRGRRVRVIDWVAFIDWSLGGSVAVWVRLAVGLCGRTIVRARATAATTMRASAFGHATMFVMGFVLALSRQLNAGVFSRCSCGSRGRTKAHASP